MRLGSAVENRGQKPLDHGILPSFLEVVRGEARIRGREPRSEATEPWFFSPPYLEVGRGERVHGEGRGVGSGGLRTVDSPFFPRFCSGLPLLEVVVFTQPGHGLTPSPRPIVVIPLLRGDNF